MLQQLATIWTIRKIARQNNFIFARKKIKSFVISISFNSTLLFTASQLLFSASKLSIYSRVTPLTVTHHRFTTQVIQYTNKSIINFTERESRRKTTSISSLKFIRLESHVPRMGDRRRRKGKGWCNEAWTISWHSWPKETLIENRTIRVRVCFVSYLATRT